MRSFKGPVYVIAKEYGVKEYMKLNGNVEWVKDPDMANRYPSRYAAKRHKQIIVGLPDTAYVEELTS